MAQLKEFKDFKYHLCSTPILILIYLQQPLNIEIDASYYTIHGFLTQHGHLVAYHSETFYDDVHRYPTYNKDMYSIVKACQQWKNCIVGKEMSIHTCHKPLHFMQTEIELHNDFHQKWSMYPQKFHLNIN
jgi:hypothetical protein